MRLRKRSQSHICACEVHESGRGLAPCMHHSQRIDEHQRMFNALRAIERGEVEDPVVAARNALIARPYVRYWHRDHPKADGSV